LTRLLHDAFFTLTVRALHSLHISHAVVRAAVLLLWP
jgi:hypothetical protein